MLLQSDEGFSTGAMRGSARVGAAVIALIAALALGLQVFVSTGLLGSPGAAIWRMLGMFTVLTNILVLGTFALIAVRGKAPGAFWMFALTLWILIVGIVYHALLAHLWRPEGAAWWADQGLHSATPIAVALWWGLFSAKTPLSWRHAAMALGWPILYLAYALVRGAMTGFYPYPFIDLDALGAGMLAFNVVALCVAFWIGGLLLITATRLMPRNGAGSATAGAA